MIALWTDASLRMEEIALAFSFPFAVPFAFFLVLFGTPYRRSNENMVLSVGLTIMSEVIVYDMMVP